MTLVMNIQKNKYKQLAVLRAVILILPYTVTHVLEEPAAYHLQGLVSWGSDCLKGWTTEGPELESR
jgi:hypothetical protein